MTETATPNGATRPFAGFEWLIAWRYMLARRREGGISVIVWYSLIGVALAVGTLIVVMAVMYGFRQEFTSRILGAEGHVKVYPTISYVNGREVRAIQDYEELAARVAEAPGVARAAPLVEGQVLTSFGQNNAGVVARGLRHDDLKTLPWIVEPEEAYGDIENFPYGVAIGAGVARELGAVVGDKITLILPGGLATPFGLAPKQRSFEVTYVFRIGRADIDRTRIYLPFEAAQDFFNRTGVADQIEVMVARPDELGDQRHPTPLQQGIAEAAGPGRFLWTWRDSNVAFLQALDIERNTMFLILAMVVLIAAMNIISGLVMLVKNKGGDIGILRTMGLTQSAIMRIFFICGAGIGLVGTLAGVILGVLFVIYIDPIFDVVNFVLGGGVWNPEVRLLSNFPAELRLYDIVRTVILSLGLSFIVTIFPARRAARLNPVEALRYE
jgi:lipoprotein-releasing system permease protein